VRELTGLIASATGGFTFAELAAHLLAAGVRLPGEDGTRG
jgi:hypothetical protein